MTELARHLQKFLVSDLIDNINNTLLNQEFISQFKESTKDFVRNRILTFQTLVYFLTNMNNSSYQAELDNYFGCINNTTEIAKTYVHKGSLTKARKKLKAEVFIAMNDRMTDYYYKHAPINTWKGFNLLAVDGTTIRVPDEKEVIEHFGVWKPVQGGECPKARASQMYDVLNEISIDTIIKPKSYGERELAAFHFLKLTPQDLVLLDRGYPSFWLFKMILTLNSNFCARVSKNWNVIKDFDLSGKNEDVVTLEASQQAKKKCKEFDLDIEPLKLRVIKIELDSGESEFLLTTLTDTSLYPMDLFSDLYHLRWPVETDYNKLKNRLQVENFSGKTVKSVYQDFYAKVFSKNLTTIIINSVQDRVEEKSKQCKYPQKVNFSQAIKKMKNRICLLFNRPLCQMKKIISALQDNFCVLTESVRNGRKFPRKHRVKQKKHFYEYKNFA